MVRHEHDGQNYWTLPGGGVEPLETLEQALVREVLEETHLHARVVKFLFEEQYTAGMTYCFLATVDISAKAKLGNDPEERDLPPRSRMLQEVAWHALKSMQDDQQVSKVLAVLSQEIS